MIKIARCIIMLLTLFILRSADIGMNTWQHWAIIGCVVGYGILGFIDGLVSK